MLPHRGTDFVRYAIAKALTQTPLEAANYAVDRWGARSGAAMIAKAAVAGVGAADLADDDLLSAAVAEFIEAASAGTVLGKLDGVRRVVANQTYCPNSEAATAFWCGEGRAAKVSRLAFERSALSPLKLMAMIVTTNEALRTVGDRAEGIIRRDLLRAVQYATDAAFIGEGAGDSDTPAAVNYNATTTASTGDVADDLAAAVELYEGDFSAAAWVLHPKLAADIALRTGGRGVGSDIGLTGGTLLRVPAICSSAVPISTSGSSITLIDASAVAVVDEGADLKASAQGAVELDDAPGAAGLTPSGQSGAVISLFAQETRFKSNCSPSLATPCAPPPRKAPTLPAKRA
jgi:HK97 family phage major capsid protein